MLFGETAKRRNLRHLTSKAAPSPETSVKEAIVADKHGTVTLIGINRPEKKNCLDVATSVQLTEALNAFEEDKEASVCILHGIGGNFCSGYDLHELAGYDGKTEENIPQFGALMNRNILSSKPLIASISGYAVGVGFELALMCDMRIIEETAVAGFLNRRLGIPIMLGGTIRLPAMIGYSRAMDLILTGRTIDANTFHNWGLATTVVPCGAALGQAINLGLTIQKYPQSALLADRMSAHYATLLAKDMDEALQFERDNSSQVLLEDGITGARKFVKGYGRHGKSANTTEPKALFREIDSEVV